MILNVLTTIRPNHHHLGSSLASFLMVFSVKTTVNINQWLPTAPH